MDFNKFFLSAAKKVNHIIEPSSGKEMRIILDFKLLPCFECRMFSFGLFPGAWSLNANISEHSVCSIFTGEG
jgi:hypothetical protein